LTEAVVAASVFSPDGSKLATAERREVQLWNTRTWQAEASLPTEREIELHTLAFSPDGKTIAAAGGAAEITFWDVAGARGWPASGGAQSVHSAARQR
jgi:WD40 repeat protein